MPISRQLLAGIILSTIVLGTVVIGFVVLDPDDDDDSSPELVQLEPVIITSDHELDEFISDNQFQGEGTPDNPYVIEYIRINNSVDVSFLVQDTEQHLIIQHSEIANGRTEGIFLNRVRNVVVADNLLYNHTGDAIYVNGSTSVIIERNEIRDIKFLAAYYDHVGTINFALSIDVAYSSYIEVRYNNISDSFDGIWFWSGVQNSSIVNNHITNIQQHGIGFGALGTPGNEDYISITVANNVIEDVIYGLWLAGAIGKFLIRNNSITNALIGLNMLTSYDIIENNTISDVDYGISLYQPRNYAIGWGNNNTVRYNMITNVFYLALSITGNHNRVHYNNFLSNDLGKSQLSDETGNNMIEYNHYNDWIEPDENDDGIVDLAYTIGGSGNNTDPSPLTSKVE